MKVVVLDVETTGLDPRRDQVVEVGAVFDDWQRPAPLCSFARLVLPERISGSVEAVAMHDGRWRDIRDRGVPVDDVMEQFWALAKELDFLLPESSRIGHKFVAAGKNYGAFDDRFLAPHLEGVGLRALHRSLDPALPYTRVTDAVPPDLKTCCERAGIPFDDRHMALADALTVCRLLRHAKGLPFLFDDPEAR
jgi:DNA polymerase III epsilon subunit-like protein